MTSRMAARLFIRMGMPIALLLLAWPTAGWPCTCGPPSRWREDPFEAPLIFVGEVETIERVNVDPASGFEAYRKVCLAVELSVWGVPADAGEVCVVTGRGDGDCGVQFRPGQEFLVYAGLEGGAPPDAGFPYTDICSGSRRVERRGPAAPRSTPLSSLGFLLAGFALGALALALLRRRPQKPNR
jgi:hypothetical protein